MSICIAVIIVFAVLFGFISGNYYYLLKTKRHNAGKVKKPAKKIPNTESEELKRYKQELYNLFMYDGTQQE